MIKFSCALLSLAMVQADILPIHLRDGGKYNRHWDVYPSKVDKPWFCSHITHDQMKHLPVYEDFIKGVTVVNEGIKGLKTSFGFPMLDINDKFTDAEFKQLQEETLKNAIEIIQQVHRFEDTSKKLPCELVQ